MSKKPPVMYRVRSIAVPTFYVCEQAGSWGRMGNKDEAMQKAAWWWKENLAPGWEKNFVLEKVD